MVDAPLEIAKQDPTQVKIQSLVTEARLAFSEDRLTTPINNNAFMRYQQILSLEPGSQLAIDGINAIVEKYLAWALDNVERRSFTRAREYVAKAENIDPGHPNLRPVKNRITEREDRTTKIFVLNPTAVSKRRVADLDLAPIVIQIERLHPFVTIKAPDDASGRWIYQILNERVDFRIEAKLELDRQTSISLTR